jgi:hypothetical protein
MTEKANAMSKTVRLCHHPERTLVLGWVVAVVMGPPVDACRHASTHDQPE